MKQLQIWEAKIGNFPDKEAYFPITGQGNNLYWDSSLNPTKFAYLPFRHNWDSKSYVITEGKSKIYKTRKELLHKVALSVWAGNESLQKKVKSNNYIITTKDFNCFLAVKQGNMYYLPDNQILDPLRIDNIYPLSEIYGEKLKQLLNSLNEKRRATKLVQSY